ncbi:hypothetical protein ACX0G7_10625 [Flavitalea antarctica]
MLSYKPPFLEVGNLTIFSDDTNPDVYYYVCLRPAIMTDAAGLPRMEAYAILPESGVGIETESILEASLMLDVNLAPTETQLRIAEKEIKEKFGKKPRLLVPAPIHNGKVYLIMAAAGNEPDPKKWFVTSEVKPSIFGENIASLVVRAQGQDAKLLIAALDSNVVAASVHYELEMLGIAPVFKAQMRVNWSKVYHHFEEFEKTNFIFYTDEISTAIDKLKETSAISITIEELDPVIKSEAMKSLVNELKSEVMKKLFHPASSPLSASEKVEDRIANGISRVLSSIAPGVHHIRRNIEETQLSETTVNLAQRNVKTYPFFPQSLLSSLIRDAGGIKEKIKWIRLDEIPFIDQRVEVRLAADTFKNSNIKSVVIQCRVIDADADDIIVQRNIVFDSDDNLQNHFNFTRQKDTNYNYDYKATMFMTTESNKIPGKCELEWTTEKGPYIYFNASEYVETREISINLDDTTIFDQTHLIEATVKVLDQADKGLVLQRTYLFNRADNQKKVLSIVANKTISVQFDVELTYFIAASKEHKVAFNNVQSNFFFVPNPFENKWSVDILCHADWAKTQKVILETRVRDAERADPLVNKFDFKRDLTETKLGVSVSLNTPREVFEYRVTCLTVNADVIQGPWRQHGGPMLVINDRIQSERIIRATLTKSPDFRAKEIKQVTIEFIYQDKENNIAIETDRLAFKNIGDTVSFKHPMPNFNHKEFNYRVRARSRSGDAYKTDLLTADRETISIELPNNIW